MSYDSLTKNRKLLNYLFNRKTFKNNYFNADNEEGYKWDDYDTTHFHEEKNIITITLDASVLKLYKRLYVFGEKIKI